MMAPMTEPSAIVYIVSPCLLRDFRLQENEYRFGRAERSNPDFYAEKIIDLGLAWPRELASVIAITDKTAKEGRNYSCHDDCNDCSYATSSDYW